MTATPWQWLEDQLGRYPEIELQARWTELARNLEDSVPHWGSRRWPLDPLPGLLTEHDWEELEAGLVQRAQLLNALLEDAYGQQLCLKEGWLPPELFYANPLWLDPCHGMVDSPLGRLLFYAVDVLYDAQFGWQVVRDRTQCPPGFGSILQNRRWMTRAYHELFAEQHIQPIAPAFQGVRESLREIGQILSSSRVVMLTGPNGSSQSMDDAALAQQLGCALVEGEDLSVRGGQVYLKQLEGLQPVELILRRLPDAHCDPLEFPGAGLGGVVALLQAVRGGNVVVTNSLGSGWLSSPALPQFLPRLCQELLGSPLLLPSLETSWPTAPSHLGNWVARPFRGGPVQLLAEWNSESRRSWLDRQRPGEWVFQRYGQASKFKCQREGQLRSIPGVVRCYLVATPAGYRLIPGGLVRLREPGQGQVFCKDLWRLNDSCSESDASTVNHPGLRSEPVALSRAGFDLPSRVAEQFYWYGRYLERCESLLRLARCLALRRAQEEESEPLASVERFLAHHESVGPDLATWASGHEPDQLQALLLHLERLGGSLRDRASADLPKVLAALPQPQHPLDSGPLVHYFEQLSIPLWALVAVSRESLYRGYGFRFLEIGRRLERARQICELLETLGKWDTASWCDLEIVLDATDSTRTYHRRYPGGLERVPMLDLLLCDDTHPRSLAYQLRALDEHFQHLPQPGTAHLHVHQQTLAELRAQLLDWQPEPTPPLERFQMALGQISGGLSSVYLSHLQPHFQDGSQ